MSDATKLSPREVRRSLALNVLNGALFNFGQRLIDPPVILPRFISELTSSNLLIGLVSPLWDACWFFPQILYSARIQRMERKMPGYRVAAAVRTIATILLASAIWYVDDPASLLIVFFVLFCGSRLAAGLTGLVYFDITAKTVPAARRGGMFAMRQFFGGILGLGAGWLVRMILDDPTLSTQQGYAVLFAGYSAAMIVAYACFMIIREPPGAAIARHVTLREQLQRAGGLLRQDDNYRRHLMTRLFLGLSGIALPFYGIYAKDVLGAPLSMVGVYVTVRVGAQLACNIPWGRLSDRRGNRLVMRLLCLGSSLTVLLALTLTVLTALLHLEGSWLPYLAIPLYILDGAVRPGHALAGSNYLIELIPETERPLYLGFSNTIMGIVVLLSGLGGLVTDAFGFSGLFAISLGLSLTACVLAVKLPEPRQP